MKSPRKRRPPIRNVGGGLRFTFLPRGEGTPPTTESARYHAAACRLFRPELLQRDGLVHDDFAGFIVDPDGDRGIGAVPVDFDHAVIIQ